MESITKLMNLEHQKIDVIFAEFKGFLSKDNEKAKEVFSKFKWNLEKHFFIEEKAVFQLYSSIENQDVSDMFKLIEEHEQMIGIIKVIEENLNQSAINEEEILKLDTLLKEHHDFEDDMFYPKLDKTLSDDQKKFIGQRSKELLRG